MSRPPVILVADDEKDLCDVLKKVLTKEGYKVLTATSGRQVLAQLKTEDVRLVLLDLKMPGMDGLETLKRIRAKRGDRRSVPVVILTAYGSLSSAREAMALGAVDYLTKPFDLNVVKTVVREALSER